ncbi:MAG TPA: hypothetical protein VFQ16_03975 [Burkholderiaceae bacterium]|nr:hypothetical protein [Burkholderiaceae bacterium]
MKRVWWALPGLSLLVLGAHFYRAGQAWAVLVCGVAVLLLAWPRAAAVRAVQAVLLLGALEWAWTAAVLAQQRIALGRPWGRMAAILGGVALLTAAAAFVLRHRLPPRRPAGPPGQSS